jgi:septum formation protein
MLANTTNTVTTSVALVQVASQPRQDNTQVIKHFIGVESADVHFLPYDQAKVDEYIATGDWRDKAGAYGIQSGAHTLVKGISGNYDTIIGLPTHTLAVFLGEVGIHATPVDLEPPVPRI